MKSQKKMHLILHRRSEKSKTNVSSDGVNQGDTFELRYIEQILKEFYGSSDPSNFITNNPIFRKHSDQTKKSPMKRITRKHKERDDDIKSCIANSDEKMVDSNILHHVAEKLRWKGKHN